VIDRTSEWFAQSDLSWGAGLGAFLAAVVLFVVANGLIVFLVVRMPATYFSGPPAGSSRGNRPRAIRWAKAIGKNLLGGLAVLGGVVLSLPGVPGPGLVLILIGLMLLDFPGKRRLVRRLVRNPSVLRTINWLRRRFGKPALVLDRLEPDR
jgi:hypothetical protein